jgi:hemerythrin-like domain-containing protein
MKSEARKVGFGCFGQQWLILLASMVVGAGLAMGDGAVSASEGKDEDESEVTANEDLMREHGIIRRALLVYGEAARRARSAPDRMPLPSLAETAKLLRDFAEDYHERGLEEAHIFPVVRKAKGPAARLRDTLLAQHRRGREITDYVRKVTSKPALNATQAESLARALEDFVRMYEPHAAREDTELFPAWKAALGRKAYAEMGERFEEIERSTFGGDGFDDALARIARIETDFGIADLAAYTPPAPQGTTRPN